MEKRNRIANLVNSKLYPLLLFVVSFIFVMLFSRSTSFLYVFEGGDPSVFKQMGLALLRGKILYVDYFDNKGCILYFIQALGLWLGGDFFIMLMQIISLTITLMIWDKMLALYCNERQRFVFLVIALIMLLCFYSAGDQTQEWCLPYISYPLLVYFRAYKSNKEIKPIHWFLIGLCFGIITFIQVNNACVLIGFVVYYWIQQILKKDYKKLILNIAWFALGWMVIAVACVLYFYFKAGWHGVYEMLYASFLSNFEYIGVRFSRRPFFYIPYVVLLLTFVLFQIFNLYKKKDILIPALISLFLFAGTFGTLCNMYYLMAILPLCIVDMMVIDFFGKRKVNYCLGGVFLVCMAYYACNPLLHFVEDLICHKERELVIYDDFHRCIENIPEVERDSIYNYNLYSPATSMMQHEGLIQCNRVLFTSLVFCLPTLWDEEMSQPFIAPKWLMVSWDVPYEYEDAIFIIDNYDLCCEFMYDKVYLEKPKVGEALKVCIYRRKY